ncbi:hypothetical protein WH297_06345 [Ochrobactrum vermis]|uniref:Uncharacterized protein n=1 Tax=Ochrobactrum vermis TaxID=1827297 RepID=A0ABU8PCG3_9HYPH|nr:hypothetical protein [Ochrobactrum vermis]PQZ29839.1 hypothetical protein CQZ93_06480 [Ochrobactrum vermis]
MIYPVHDSRGTRIGTIMTEKDGAQQDSWVAYGVNGQRETLSSWDAAFKWVLELASQTHSKS